MNTIHQKNTRQIIGFDECNHDLSVFVYVFLTKPIENISVTDSKVQEIFENCLPSHYFYTKRIIPLYFEVVSSIY